MSLYVVERYLVGWTDGEIREMVARAATVAPSMTAAGVRYVSSLVIPGDEMCLALYEGPDEATVRAVNIEHDLPTGRVLLGRVSAGEAA